MRGGAPGVSAAPIERTLGTRDGATIEMAQDKGEENLVLFRLTAQQEVSGGWYNPHWHYEYEPEARAALDLMRLEQLSRSELGIFGRLLGTLLTQSLRDNQHVANEAHARRHPRRFFSAFPSVPRPYCALECYQPVHDTHADKPSVKIGAAIERALDGSF